MNFLSLEYFLMAAKEKSIKKAAEKLFVSQQSLSEHIKKLEKELGVELIARTRPHSLTEAGLRLENGAKEIFDAKKSMLDDIHTIKTRLSPDVLTIGIHPAGEPEFLPELILRFKEKYPDCAVKLTSYYNEDKEQIGLFFPTSPLDNAFNHVILMQDHVVLMVHSTLLQRIYGDETQCVIRRLTENCNISDLADLPFIISSDSAQDIKRLANTNGGFEPLVVFRADRFNLMTAMCVNGAGAMLSVEEYQKRAIIRDYGRIPDGLLFFRLKEQVKDCCLAISYRKGKRLSQLEQSFIRLAKEMLSGPGQPISETDMEPLGSRSGSF